jgi:hypothetical protein
MRRVGRGEDVAEQNVFSTIVLVVDAQLNAQQHETQQGTEGTKEEAEDDDDVQSFEK